jgi:integrase
VLLNAPRFGWRPPWKEQRLAADHLLLYARVDNGWKFQPVRKTSQGKFVWDRSDNGAYYLEWNEDGSRRRARAGTSPAEVLEARRRKILELKGRATEQGRIVAPTLSEEETPVPLTATVDAYLNHVKVNQKLNTYRRYRSVLAHFRDYLASKRYLNEISRGNILEFRDFRATQVASPVTLNTEITMIRAFLFWCVEFRNLRGNPASKIKPRQVLQKPPTVYSEKELGEMLKIGDATERALLLTLCYTGMREQEICHLAWKDVDLKKKVLRVSAKPSYGFTPKTWEERRFEMSDRLVDAFKKLPRVSEWVFPTGRGKRQAHTGHHSFHEIRQSGSAFLIPSFFASCSRFAERFLGFGDSAGDCLEYRYHNPPTTRTMRTIASSSGIGSRVKASRLYGI